MDALRELDNGTQKKLLADDMPDKAANALPGSSVVLG
jgi:hypothetical protein